MEGRLKVSTRVYPTSAGPGDGGVRRRGVDPLLDDLELTTLRLLAFAASLRRDSWNRKLVGLAAGLAREAGAEVDVAEFREFDMPLYDADLQALSGIPAGASELARRIGAAHGLSSGVSRVQLLAAGHAQERDRLGLPHPPDAAPRQERDAALGVERAGRWRSGACGSSGFRSKGSASWSIPTCTPCRGPTRRSVPTATLIEAGAAGPAGVDGARATWRWLGSWRRSSERDRHAAEPGARAVGVAQVDEMHPGTAGPASPPAPSGSGPSRESAARAVSRGRRPGPDRRGGGAGSCAGPGHAGGRATGRSPPGSARPAPPRPAARAASADAEPPSGARPERRPSASSSRRAMLRAATPGRPPSPSRTPSPTASAIRAGRPPTALSPRALRPPLLATTPRPSTSHSQGSTMNSAVAVEPVAAHRHEPADAVGVEGVEHGMGEDGDDGEQRARPAARRRRAARRGPRGERSGRSRRSRR